MGEFDTLFETLKQLMNDGFARLEKKIDKMDGESIENGKSIERLQTKLDNIQEAISRNFKQHENDFYPKLDSLETFRDKVKGALIIVGVVWGIIQAVIIMYIRSIING